MGDEPEKTENRAVAVIGTVLVTFIGMFVLIAAVNSWLNQGLLFQLMRPDSDAASRVTVLKDFFQSCGYWAPLAYLLFVMVEVVVAPLPGLMLYAPGGLLFGPLYGGLLSLTGNVLGAGLACTVSRRFSPRVAERFFSGPRVARVQTALEQRGVWMIFLLRLNPLTSTDLLSYAAGLTRIPVSRVMLATGVGLAPQCLIQSWLSDRLLNAFPQLIMPLIMMGIVTCITAVWIILRLLRPASV
jgi:uncharacterized membrane protein YdjX (TVP38/TMEM64 family)